MSLRNYYKDKSVKFLLEQLDEDEYSIEDTKNSLHKQRNAIYIKTRDELNELLENYPSGAPRVVIGENVKLDRVFQKFNNNIDISNWDVSNVTNMKNMFLESNFNGDISDWDVSNVKTMSHMFFQSKFNGDISNWDVSNVEDMNGMFAYSVFNQDISGWDVSNVKNMSNIFANSKFDGDLNNWEVKLGTKMHYAFYNTPLAKKNKLPKWFDKYIWKS